MVRTSEGRAVELAEAIKKRRSVRVYTDETIGPEYHPAGTIIVGHPGQEAPCVPQKAATIHRVG